MSDDVIPMYSKHLFLTILLVRRVDNHSIVRYGITRGGRFIGIVITQTIGSRVAPKVLHMEQVTGSRTSIIAPKNMMKMFTSSLQ